MATRQAEDFWWNDVAGPSSLVHGIVNAVIECKSALLEIPADLPWRHQMRNAVRNAMELTPGLDGLYIESFDVEDEGGQLTPGNFLLEKAVLYEDRIHYRSGKESVQQYAARKGLLANKLIWIKGTGPKETASWIDFCRQWHPHDPMQGIFVIEDRWGVGDPTGALVSVDYSACVDENSVRLFAWSMLSERGGNGLDAMWRKYMVSLLTNLCRDDVEVASALIDELDIKRDDPLGIIRTISQYPQFERRGEPGSDHVLALAKESREDELRLRLWMSQIEVLFPAIEEARVAIVDSLGGDIADLIEGDGIVQFGSPVERAQDVELGTLVYLMSAKDCDGSRKLYIDSQEDRDRIFLLWRCRNLLAHREVCPPSLIGDLFDDISH